MHFQLLTILRNVGRIEEQRIDPSKELVVELDPLDAEPDSLTRCRVSVSELDAPEGGVEKFNHVAVDNGDADAFQ